MSWLSASSTPSEIQEAEVSQDYPRLASSCIGSNCTRSQCFCGPSYSLQTQRSTIAGILRFSGNRANVRDVCEFMLLFCLRVSDFLLDTKKRGLAGESIIVDTENKDI